MIRLTDGAIQTMIVQGLIIDSLEKAGIPAKSSGATYTGNMPEVLPKIGFKNVVATVNLATGSGLQREIFFLVTGIQHSIVEMERLYMRASMRKEPRQEENLETKQVEKFASGVIIISHGSMFTDIPEKPAMLVQ